MALAVAPLCVSVSLAPGSILPSSGTRGGWLGWFALVEPRGTRETRLLGQGGRLRCRKHCHERTPLGLMKTENEFQLAAPRLAGQRSRGIPAPSTPTRPCLPFWRLQPAPRVTGLSGNAPLNARETNGYVVCRGGQKNGPPTFVGAAHDHEKEEVVERHFRAPALLCRIPVSSERRGGGGVYS